MSAKLRAKLKKLERNPKCVSFGLTLDEVSDRVNRKPIRRRD